MNKQHHILTVGISLLTNFQKSKQVDLAYTLRHSEQIVAFLRENPTAHCAEINSLEARTGFLSKPNCQLSVSLIYSQSTAGRLASKLIGKFLAAMKVRVTEIKLANFDLPGSAAADPEVAQKLAEDGLADLRQKVARHITHLQTQDPKLSIHLNCTGGYKAECAVLYELGRTLRLPVYYLHETFKVAVELP